MKYKFKVVHGIEIPKRASGQNGDSMYPWVEMKKGSSFFVSRGTRNLTTLQSTIIGAARHQKAVKGLKITTRRTKIGKSEGIRVWRIA